MTAFKPTLRALSGMRLKPLALLVALSAAALLQPAVARAESVLRVAMTAGDIPDWTGQPDQGFEGYRFVGWSLYDALVNWDLSRSDREAPLTQGLAPSGRLIREQQTVDLRAAQGRQIP